MAARSTLILKDRTSPTPVNRTYTPDGDDKNGVHLFSEKGAVPLGNPRYSIGLKPSANRYQATIRLTVPVVQTQTVNGVSTPIIARTTRLSFTADFDGLSTEQERADAIGMFVDSLSASQTQVNDLVVKLTDIY